MNQYSKLEIEMQEAFESMMPLTSAQSGRLTQMCNALIEAQDITLSKLARVLPRQSSQPSRSQWVQRILKTPFLTQHHLYRPLLNWALRVHNTEEWHLILDRTELSTREYDLAMISLHYFGRSVPIHWQPVNRGGAEAVVYRDMIREVAGWLPLLPSQTVIFHADSEFGTITLLQELKALRWDFIVGIRGQHYLCDPRTDTRQPFEQYDIPDSKTLRIPDVACFVSQPVAINAFAFREEHHNAGQKKRDCRYLVTSLPLDDAIKRVGRRRWGIEPLFKDYKSAGWRINHSYVCDARFQGLLVVLAICYLWMVTTGRWLSKTSQRHKIDNHRQRHYSLFRIGWDFIVHKIKIAQPPPTPFTLYT